MSIDPLKRKYLVLLVTRMREHNKKAQDASAEWEKLNEEIKNWMRDSGHTDPVKQDRIKSSNLALQGHMDTWSFHEREAKRHAMTIMAESEADGMMRMLG